jgi:hypothetical protein
VKFNVTDIKKLTEWREKNKDGYGNAVFVYAENWAKMMQKQLDNGKQISEVHEKCSHDSDIEGITGFQFGYAKQILAQFWVHGTELKLLYPN